MTANETARETAESAAEVLATDADVLAAVDAAGLGEATLAVLRRAAGNPGAGIVNPPGPKAWYEAGDYNGAEPETWRRATSKHKGSWWEDWTAWSDARAGEHVKPPSMGSKQYPAADDAPGEYVFG